jgi:hypothetical protein
MKYKAGDMVFSVVGSCWYYIINKHKVFFSGVKEDGYTGTFILPKEQPQVRKKVAGEDSDCHCGSYAVGITSKGKGHSSWCPMAKE